LTRRLYSRPPMEREASAERGTAVQSTMVAAVPVFRKDGTWCVARHRFRLLCCVDRDFVAVDRDLFDVDRDLFGVDGTCSMLIGACSVLIGACSVLIETCLALIENCLVLIAISFRRFWIFRCCTAPLSRVSRFFFVFPCAWFVFLDFFRVHRPLVSRFGIFFHVRASDGARGFSRATSAAQNATRGFSRATGVAQNGARGFSRARGAAHAVGTASARMRRRGPASLERAIRRPNNTRRRRFFSPARPRARAQTRHSRGGRRRVL